MDLGCGRGVRGLFIPLPLGGGGSRCFPFFFEEVPGDPFGGVHVWAFDFLLISVGFFPDS